MPPLEETERIPQFNLTDIHLDAINKQFDEIKSLLPKLEDTDFELVNKKFSELYQRVSNLERMSSGRPTPTPAFTAPDPNAGSSAATGTKTDTQAPNQGTS